MTWRELFDRVDSSDVTVEDIETALKQRREADD